MAAGDVPGVVTTPGGLRGICEPMAGVRSVAFGVWIGVGSRVEAAAVGGVSHFLEHMLFKGTPEHSAEQIAQVFDGMGGEVNAMTGRDYTVVYMRVLDELVERGLGVMSQMVAAPTFADLDQERGVVIEEIAMYEDDPQDQVHDMLGEAIFPDQPLGRPIIGTREVIGSIPEADVRGHHAAYYTAPNIVVAAAGNITAERTRELAERYLGGLSRATAPSGVEPARAGGPRLTILEKPTEQVHLCLGGPGLARSDPRRHAQSVLDTVLGGLMSSRLFQEVREKRGLAYSVGSYTIAYGDAGQVAVHLGTREDNVGLACEVIGAELRRLARDPVPADELARAKDHLTGRMVLGLESPGNRMNRLGRTVVTDAELLSIDEIIRRIRAVTADDITALAREFWQPEGLSIVAVGPDGDVVREASARLGGDRLEADA